MSSTVIPKYSEVEVIYQIREIWPELENPGWVLWNCTAFPFFDGADPLIHWLAQVEEYLASEGNNDG